MSWPTAAFLIAILFGVPVAYFVCGMLTDCYIARQERIGREARKC